MTRSVHRKRRRTRMWFRTLLFALSLCVLPAGADEMDARLRVAINLFPAFLAARTDLQAGPPAGRVVVLYAERTARGDASFEHLRASLARRTPAITTVNLAIADWLQEPDDVDTHSLFIAHRLDSPLLERVLAEAGRNQVLSYSPIPGDVERGVLGGVSVSDRILPRVNLRTMVAHGVHFKDFFLRVADRYE